MRIAGSPISLLTNASPAMPRMAVHQVREPRPMHGIDVLQNRVVCS